MSTDRLHVLPAGITRNKKWDLNNAQVIPPLTYTLSVTPGKAGSPASVALNGTLAASLKQTYGIELKSRSAGGLPCSPAPSPQTAPGHCSSRNH